MPINTKYSPSHSSQYSAKDINADFRGFKFTADAGQATTHEWAAPYDIIIDGGAMSTIGASLGDSVSLQVIDKDNILGYGANTVLGQYVTNWFMNPQESVQINFQNGYPAKIVGGLYLRAIYYSVGGTDVEVILNYRLHKVLW